MPPTLDTRSRPLRDLRISVTDRCNFRCPYCMPADQVPPDARFLPRSKVLRFEEIERVARLAAELGVHKIRLTGGEPLLRRELPQLVAALGRIDGIDDIALTTNGVLLPRHAPALAEAGLARVTVSLDALDPVAFARLSGGVGATVDQVLAGLDAAREAGLGPLKVNCVVQRGENEDQVLPLVEHFRGSGVVVRFIEFMDVGTENGWRREGVVPAEEILAAVEAAHPLEPLAPSTPGEVATRYRLRDGSGEIGVIASVTRPFCGGCTRARLTPEGELFTCLFGTRGVDLRTPLRRGASDDTLRGLLRGTWTARDDRYSEVRGEGGDGTDRVEMYRVGG